ncbi:MAG: helix-turn-helix domain-containing protein [Sneathiella sp.]
MMAEPCPYCGTLNHNIHLNEIWFREDRSLVVTGHQEIELTRTQYAILHMLFKRMPHTVSHESLMSALYEERSDPPFDTTLKMHVMKLRKRLMDTNLYVITDWGLGYRLEYPLP